MVFGVPRFPRFRSPQIFGQSVGGCLGDPPDETALGARLCPSPIPAQPSLAQPRKRGDGDGALGESAGPLKRSSLSQRPTRHFPALSRAERPPGLPGPAAERVGEHLGKGLGLSRRKGRPPALCLQSGCELSGGVSSPLRKRTVPYAYLTLFVCSTQLTRSWRLTRGT